MSTYTGILIPETPGEDPTIHQGLTFAEMKKLMGINLARVAYTHPDGSYTIWADEEALLAGDPVQNYRVTHLILKESNLYHPVVGPVFIGGGVDENGENLPLDAQVMGRLMRAMGVPTQQFLEQVRQINDIAAGTRNN